MFVVGVQAGQVRVERVIVWVDPFVHPFVTPWGHTQVCDCFCSKLFPLQALVGCPVFW